MARLHDQAAETLAAASASRDILSDVLTTVRLTGALFFTVDATSPWSAEVPDGATLAPVVAPRAQQVISYHLVTRGTCWGKLPSQAPVRLDAGDVLVLTHGDRYAMATAEAHFGPADDPRELAFLAQMAAGVLPRAVADGGGGSRAGGRAAQRAQLICGFLGCDLWPFNPLLLSLPRLLHVRRALRVGDATDAVAHLDDDRDGDGAALGRLVDMALRESRRRVPGGACVLERVAELLFVEVIRRHLATSSGKSAGWLAGVRDPFVGRALAALHASPAHPFTLASLARSAGLARSSLSDRFTRLVGCAPMQYLTRWRLQSAAGLLADGAAKVSAVAAEVGYASEAAFSRAFKKATGVAPSAWRDGTRPSLLAPGKPPEGRGRGRLARDRRSSP